MDSHNTDTGVKCEPVAAMSARDPLPERGLHRFTRGLAGGEDANVERVLHKRVAHAAADAHAPKVDAEETILQ